ncbi:hypothetical protein ACXIVK_24215 [Paraburkholderia caledonica]
MSEHQPINVSAAGVLSDDRPQNDAIARSKRILELVDIYVARPDRMNRNALRSHLFDEFTEAAGIVQATGQAAEPVAWMRQYMSYPDSPEDAPGFMVTSFHQNADFASKYPDENTPLYAAPSPAAREAGDGVADIRKMIDDLLAEQTYIASSRETCSQYDVARWDRIQRVVDFLTTQSERSHRTETRSDENFNIGRPDKNFSGQSFDRSSSTTND